MKIYLIAFLLIPVILFGQEQKSWEKSTAHQLIKGAAICQVTGATLLLVRQNNGNWDTASTLVIPTMLLLAGFCMDVYAFHLLTVDGMNKSSNLSLAFDGTVKLRYSF